MKLPISVILALLVWKMGGWWENILPASSSHLYQEHLNIHLVPGDGPQNTHLSTLYVKAEEVNPAI